MSKDSQPQIDPFWQKNTSPLSRRRLFVGAAGVASALAIACRDQEPPIEPNNYCVFHSDAERAFIDVEQRKPVGTPFMFGDKESLRAIIPEKLPIIQRKENAKPYKAMLVPVGYDDPVHRKRRMSELSDFMQRVYHGANVQFMYIDQSLPVSINLFERATILPDLEEEQIVKDKINKVMPIDNLIFILNTNQYCGYNFGFTSIAAGENEFTYPLLAHEYAHSFGLDDEYFGYYGPAWGSGANMMPGSELYLKDRKTGEIKMPERVRQAYLQSGQKQEFVEVGTCNGVPVVRNAYDHNLMGERWPKTKEEFLQVELEYGSVFRKDQLQLINNNIAAVIASRN